jgi:hypothetical protein
VAEERKEEALLFIGLLLLLVLMFVALGFVVRALFYVAVTLGLIWLITFFWRGIWGRR